MIDEYEIFNHAQDLMAACAESINADGDQARISEVLGLAVFALSQIARDVSEDDLYA